MKRTERRVADISLDEIRAIVKIVKKPVVRKTYLLARRFYQFHKEILVALEYKGKIEKFPKHRPKKEDVAIDSSI